MAGEWICLGVALVGLAVIAGAAAALRGRRAEARLRAVARRLEHPRIAGRTLLGDGDVVVTGRRDGFDVTVKIRGPWATVEVQVDTALRLLVEPEPGASYLQDGHRLRASPEAAAWAARDDVRGLSALTSLDGVASIFVAGGRLRVDVALTTALPPTTLADVLVRAVAFAPLFAQPAGPDVTLTARAPADGGRGPRCPFCRDAVADVAARACEVCGTVHHADCLAEVGRCTVLGCSGGWPAPEIRVRARE